MESRLPGSQDALPLDSGRKAGAALGTTVRQDRAARTGAHPSPETVLACPTPVIGLESALHGACSWGKVGRLRTPSAGRQADKSAPGYGVLLEAVKPGPFRAESPPNATSGTAHQLLAS